MIRWKSNDCKCSPATPFGLFCTSLWTSVGVLLFRFWKHEWLPDKHDSWNPAHCRTGTMSKLIWRSINPLTPAAFSQKCISYNIFAWARGEIKILSFGTRKWPTSLGFSSFLFSFSYLFAAVINPKLGLIPVQKILRKCYWDRQCLPWSGHG